MTYVFQFFTMMLTALFVENIVFTRSIGTSWMFYLTKRPKELLRYVLLLMAVTTVSGVIGYPLRGMIYNSEFRHVLIPLLYIAVMAVVYVAAYFLIKKLQRLNKAKHNKNNHCGCRKKPLISLLISRFAFALFKGKHIFIILKKQ